MKLTKEQINRLDDMLDRADAYGNDVATKVDAEGKYIRTPWDLCEEIVGQIARTISKVVSTDPDDAYLYQDALKDKKILVVDTVEFIPVLLAFGAEKCNITYVAPYAYKGASIAGVIGVRVVQQSLLEWKTDMKFDVVIGNPPYNDDDKNNLSSDFIKKSIGLTKDNGLVSLVVPVAWVNGQGRQDPVRKAMGDFKVLTDIDIQIYNSDVTTVYFPKIGKDIGYWIAINRPSTKRSKVIVINGCDKFSIRYKFYPYLPFVLNKTTWSIFRKIERWVRKQPANQISFWHEFKNEDPLSITKPAVIFPKAQYIDYSKLGIFDGTNRTVIPTSKFVISCHIPASIPQSVVELQWNSKFFNFLYFMFGGNGGASIGLIRKFPRFFKLRNEQEIYFELKFTQEEIDYIEATIK